MNHDHRHYLRLDCATQDTLEQLTRHLFTTKSELMRRYVRDGVQREAAKYADEVERLQKSGMILSSV